MLRDVSAVASFITIAEILYKAEAAILSMQVMLPRTFSFPQSNRLLGLVYMLSDLYSELLNEIHCTCHVKNE